MRRTLRGLPAGLLLRPFLLWLAIGLATAALADPPHSGSPVSAEGRSAYDLGRPDAHAPLGVMGDHTHGAGEWMLSYRYARMRMEGNRNGTRQESRSQVLARPQFTITPTDMDMEMHMFGFMFAPTSRVTLMAMLPFVRLGMDHQVMNGVQFRTESEGIGDIRVTSLFRFWESAGEGVAQRLHLNGGVSIPVGSVSRRDHTPMGRQRLPYPMQIGSGTWDLLPGLTYLGQTPRWSWGAQAIGTVRTGHNQFGYRFGNRVDLTAWGARRLTDWLSASVRGSWMWWDDIAGRDDELVAPVPTTDPNRRGGHRLDVLFGLNVQVPLGALGKGHRFAVEGGIPAYQWLSGPQLETDWRLVVGWQKSFTGFPALGE